MKTFVVKITTSTKIHEFNVESDNIFKAISRLLNECLCITVEECKDIVNVDILDITPE